MTSVLLIRRNSIFSFLVFGLRLVANMVLFVGIARFYGPTAFAQFSLAHVYLSIMMLIADFGYDFYLATEIGRDVRLTSELARKVMPIKILLSVCAVGLITGLAIFGQSDDEVKMLMIVLAIGIPANTLMTFVGALLRGNQDVFPEARVAFEQNSLLLVLLVIIALLGLPLLAVAGAFAASRIYGFITLWRQARLRFPGLQWSSRIPEAEKTKALAGIGLTFGLHMLFSTLYFQIDTILLDRLSGQEAVGQYQAVMKLAALVLVLNEVAITAMIPVLAQTFSTDEDRWFRIAKVVCKSLLLIGGFIGLVFFVSPVEILQMVYGTGVFDASVPVMRIFGVILLIRFFMETYAMMLTSAKKQQSRTIVVVLATIANVSANLILIPRFGILGAAWVSLATNALIALAYWGLVSVLTRHWFPLLDSGQLLIFTGFIVTGGVLWILGITSLAAVLPLSVAVTVALTFVGFSRQEQGVLSSFLRLRGS